MVAEARRRRAVVVDGHNRAKTADGAKAEEEGPRSLAVHNSQSLSDHCLLGIASQPHQGMVRKTMQSSCKRG